MQKPTEILSYAPSLPNRLPDRLAIASFYFFLAAVMVTALLLCLGKYLPVGSASAGSAFFVGLLAAWMIPLAGLTLGVVSLFFKTKRKKAAIISITGCVLLLAFVSGGFA